jgi:lipopolysaccharide biosynthesis glycosyltransferase
VEQIDIFMVIEDEASEEAAAIINRFELNSKTIKIFPAAKVVSGIDDSRSRYGLFTSGHSLDLSAYYRIYFAKLLAKERVYRRAVYFDSDIVFQSTASAMLTMDLQGQPLAARLEVDRPEVRRAINVHKLQPARYFNSGVLIFDLLHYSLEKHLDDAIKAVSDPAVTLLFHDQCALNIGFNNNFHTLDEKYNRFVSRSSSNSDLENGCVLHFLDRPKPWDIGCSAKSAEIWYEKWQRLAEVIGNEDAVRVLNWSVT